MKEHMQLAVDRRAVTPEERAREVLATLADVLHESRGGEPCPVNGYSTWCRTTAQDVLDALAAAGLRVVAEGHAVIDGVVVRLGERMTTYKDPDGGLVADYEFVTGLEWFEDEDDPRPLRRQTWVLVEDVVGTHYPSGPMLCPFCEDDDSCSVCGGTGEHPYRHAGFVPAGENKVSKLTPVGCAPDTEGRPTAEGVER